MANSSKIQSNKQESEAQRKEADTSAESTSLISSAPSLEEQSQISPADEQAQVKDAVDRMLGKDEELAGELISVKTLGPYLIHDPTTGDTVEESGSKVRNSAFIRDQLEAGRIKKA